MTDKNTRVIINLFPPKVALKFFCFFLMSMNFYHFISGGPRISREQDVILLGYILRSFVRVCVEGILCVLFTSLPDGRETLQISCRGHTNMNPRKCNVNCTPLSSNLSLLVCVDAL